MNKIHYYLTQKGYHRSDVAQRMGIPLQMMHNYCNEQAKIPYDLLVCIAKMLGVGIDDLGVDKVGSPKYANATDDERKKFTAMAESLGVNPEDLGLGGAGWSEIDSRIEKLKSDIDNIKARMDSITYRHPDFSILVSTLGSKRVRLQALERQRDKYPSQCGSFD